MSDYWNRVMDRRTSRRGVVVGGASLAGAAALLAACGGGESTHKEASSLVTEPVDSTAKAKPGGRMTLITPNDISSFDGIAGNTGISFTMAVHAHSRLLKYVPGKSPDSPDGSVEPDAATSYEVSADGLKWIFHLRPNMKFDPRPPTNGRVMTSEDMKFTWDRFAALNQGRTDLTGRPEAPIESVTVPDANTFIFNLRFPYAPLATMLPFYRYMSIQPKELESYNYKSEMRGTGPWRLREYVASSKVVFDKNPDWYGADKVMLEGIDYYIVPEYAAALSQFRAGNVWAYDTIAQEEIIQQKNDIPELQLQTSGVFTRSITPYTAFSVLPGSPFLDERVRQAMSVLLDRPTWIDTFFNVDSFTKQGLPVKTAWNSSMPAGQPKWWVDPQSSEMGAGAKFFEFDPAEAKKLLSAAGYTKPVEAKLNWTHNGYNDTYRRHVEVHQGMWEAFNDFKFARTQHDYATVWTPNFHQGNGKYDGVAIGTLTTLPDLDGLLYAVYRSGGVKTWWGQVDPQMDSIIDAQRKEPDTNKRIALVKDFQRYHATKMYSLSAPGEGLKFTLAQPWYGNRGLYRHYESGNEATEKYTREWYDSSKKS